MRFQIFPGGITHAEQSQSDVRRPFVTAVRQALTKIQDGFWKYLKGELGFEIKGKTLRLHKLRTDRDPDKSLISGMRGKATSGMTTDEIMAMTRGNDGNSD